MDNQMKQKRHATNELYRLVVDELSSDIVRTEQEEVTGKKLSAQTVQRYYNGYGPYQAIPRPAYEAALRLTSATFYVAKLTALPRKIKK